jgi:hypothetical protein
MATAATTDWIQIAAPVLTLVVTAWLAYLTSRYVRVTERIARSAQQQLDDALKAGQERVHRLAATLLEETHRIRAELGQRPDPDGGYGQDLYGVTVPTVHPWIQTLIPGIGLTDARIVGLFLKLSADLDHYRGWHTDLIHHHLSLNSTLNELLSIGRDYPEDP